MDGMWQDIHLPLEEGPFTRLQPPNPPLLHLSSEAALWIKKNAVPFKQRGNKCGQGSSKATGVATERQPELVGKLENDNQKARYQLHHKKKLTAGWQAFTDYSFWQSSSKTKSWHPLLKGSQHGVERREAFQSFLGMAFSTYIWWWPEKQYSFSKPHAYQGTRVTASKHQ